MLASLRLTIARNVKNRLRTGVHNLASSFVLGYHGCDPGTAEKLLNGAHFEPSENDYDWLGSGVYFWETNPDRALSWARFVAKRRGHQPESMDESCVVGAVIDLGLCLDLVSTNGLLAVEAAYEEFTRVMNASGSPMPQNSGGPDLLLRKLDCAVINYLHRARHLRNEPEFDTVHGVFTEGGPLYPTSGFLKKTHIQICVRNPQKLIKGVFRVPLEHFSHPLRGPGSIG